MIIEQWQKRATPELLNRNLVIFVAWACGLPEVRRFLCAKLETILLNNKLLKAAQEALSYCCANIISPNEQENITHIINVRWRQKPPTYYLQSLLLLIDRVSA